MGKHLEVLRNLDVVIEELKKTKLPASYWVEEEEMLEEMRKEQVDITMSYEKFHQPFTI